MKAQLQVLLNAKDSLVALSKCPLNAKIAFKVAKIIKEISSELSIFETTQFELVKKYGSEDKDNPQVYRVNPENMDAYREELTELLEHEIELQIQKISLAEITCDITAKQYLDLEFLIEE